MRIIKKKTNKPSVSFSWICGCYFRYLLVLNSFQSWNSHHWAESQLQTSHFLKNCLKCNRRQEWTSCYKWCSTLQYCVHCLLFSQIFKYLSWTDFGVGRGHCGHPFYCEFLSVTATPFWIFWIRPCLLQFMNILPFISHLFTLVKDSKFLIGLVITKRINHRVVFTNETVLYNFHQTLRNFTHYFSTPAKDHDFPHPWKKLCFLAFP